MDAQIDQAAAMQQILDALRKIATHGLSRYEATVLIADRLQVDWCNVKLTWVTRKRRVKELLDLIDEMAKGGSA